MHWKHYWRNVITRYHVVIEGWPDDIPFKNLSEISSGLPALESLLRKLEAGKIYWKAISRAEYKEMEADCNARLEDGTVKQPSPCRTRSDKGKKRSRHSCPTDDGEESDNDSESGSEHPKKTTKKAWHYREVSNGGNSSDSNAARDREVHGSATTANHTANPGAVKSQVESVEN